jgi:hypothetical protein
MQFEASEGFYYEVAYLSIGHANTPDGVKMTFPFCEW